MLRKIKSLRGLVVIGTLITVVLGLSFAAAEAWWWREEEREVKTLKLALLPAEDPGAMITNFEPARQYLENELGISIEMHKAVSYIAVIEALRFGKVDIAVLGPFTYVLASERANIRAIAGVGFADTGAIGVYYSVLITHRDSGLRSIDDIKARAGELTVSFPDPGSTSGHLIPRGHMEYIGISVGKDFKEIVFAGGHDATILAVGARKVDFGATAYGRLLLAVERGVICPDDVFVIWKSDGIPNAPVVVRGDLDEALIQRIQQAYMDMAQKDPEAFAAVQKVEAEVGDTFVIVTGAEYEFVRQVAIGLGKL